MHLQTCTITASKIAPSFPRSLSPNSIKSGPKLAPSRPPKWMSKLVPLQPPSKHNFALHSHLQTGMITTSQLAWSRPPTVSPNLHNYGLQVHLQNRRITAHKFAWSWSPSWNTNSLDYYLGVYLKVHFITASNCISIHAWLPPAIPCPNSLDHRPGVYLWLY